VPTPDWLLRDEAYAPRPDRDAFIDKSIRTLLRVLGMLRRRTDGANARGGIDPRVGLVTALAVVVLVSLSRSAVFLACAGVLLLVILSLQRGEVIRDVSRPSFAAGLFTAAIMLPSAIWGDPAGAVRLTLKVLICVASVRLFSATAEWRGITRAISAFRVPDIFILVLDTTLRSLALMGELSVALLYALRLRSVGRNPRKTTALSGVAGTLFLKSRRMMEDMQSAMECRGFTGSYRASRMPRLRVLDCLPLLLPALLAGVFFMTGA